MSEIDTLILDLTYILVVAGITTLIFKKINQPVVLGYIVAGFITSPHFTLLPTIGDGATITIWADIGIIFLMFALGLEFSFHKIAKVGGSAIITAITVMGAMILVGILAGTLLGFTHMDSIFLGGMISMSSTMIILKAYDEMKLKKEKFSQLVLGILVLEDIAGIFMMIILSTISVSKSFSGFDLMKQIVFLLIMLVIMLILGIYLMPTILNRASRLMNNETLLIISLAFCFGMVVIAHAIGFSEALGAFLAGSILAGTKFAERIDKMVQPLKDLFGAIFFVSVGMMVMPETLVDYLIPIVIITVITIIGQMIFSTIGSLLSGCSLHTAVRVGFSMVQVGEFSFIIATLGMSLGVISDFLYPIIVCVSVITTFTTPIFIKSGEKAYIFIDKHLPKKIHRILRQYTSENRSTREDADWKEFLSKTFIRIAVCGSALFAIYVLSTRVVSPFLSAHIGPATGKIAMLIVTLIAMSPFINLMYSRKRVLFTKLWLKSNYNRLPLLFFNAIKMFICVMTVVITVAYYSMIPYWAGVVVGLVLVGLIVKSDFMRSRTLDIEMRFVRNFNEKMLEKARSERGISEKFNWIDEKLFVVTFKVTRQMRRNTLRDYQARKRFGVMIIQIRNEEKLINLPGADSVIEAGDTLVALGTRNQVESYVMLLEQSESIENPKEDIVTLRDYMYGQIFHEVEPEEQLLCCAVPVSKGSSLARSSLKTSNFINDYGGFIVGIERGSLSIIQPEQNTFIAEGDILWALGTQKMVNRLLKAGMLSN